MRTLKARIRSGIRAFFPTPTYAVLYDNLADDGDAGDQYYGWFETPEEAEKVFNQAYGGNEQIRNPRLARVVRTIDGFHD